MKKIFITEEQFQLLKELNEEEVTFFEFYTNIKTFLKDLLNKPTEAEPNSILLNKISKDGLLKKMDKMGIIVKKERVDEVPVSGSDKKVGKCFIQYQVPKHNFENKVKSLYKDLFVESYSNMISTCPNIIGVQSGKFTEKIADKINSQKDTYKPQVFKDNKQIINDMIEMDDDNAYKDRGGIDMSIMNEDGVGGATSCGSVMQGGGSNPDAGQYTLPFGDVQRKSFYSDTLKRNKDEKNGSISMNRKK